LRPGCTDPGTDNCPIAYATINGSTHRTCCQFPYGKFIDLDNEEAGYEFNADGTWRAFNSIYTMGRGTYSAKGDLYIEETNSENCGTSPMSFKYSFDGTNLKFELAEESMNDDCDGRKMSFDGKTYVLSE